MKTHAELKPLSNGRKTYLYVYYQSKGQKLKINTGYEYQKSYMDKDLYFNKNKKDYEAMNDRIRYILTKTNEYIHRKLKRGQTVDQQECIRMVVPEKRKEYGKRIYEKIYTKVLTWYEEFYNFKSKELQNPWSLKDYKSLWNLLIDFERDNGHLEIDTINSKNWLLDFRNYLQEPRPDESNKKKKDRIYLSRGYLTDTTINKRLQTLKNFFSWIEKNKGVVIKKEVMTFNVSKKPQEIIFLTLDELKELYYFEKYTEKERLVMDTFIFACFTSLRYGDLKSFNKDFLVEDESGNMFYSIYNEKTDIELNIPILQIPREILERYNYKLHIYANAVLNRRLKEVLKKHNFLETTVYKNEKRKNKTKKIPMLKREAVTMHTARKTFITNAKLLGISDTIIMAATGHKSLQIMQKYAAKVRDYNAFLGMEQGTKNIDAAQPPNQ